MTSIEGSIDDLKRPLIRLELPGFLDSVVAFIDTGFNGTIIVDEAQAAKLGFRILKDGHANLRLAGQRREDFLVGWGRFSWFSERKAIAAYILIETRRERSARIARRTEEEILIGTELLSDCRLEIDFPARRVRVTKVA